MKEMSKWVGIVLYFINYCLRIMLFVFLLYRIFKKVEFFNSEELILEVLEKKFV